MRSLSLAPPIAAAAVTRSFSHGFVINPLERLNFALSFVLATGCGSLLVQLVLRTLQNPALPTPWQASGLLGAFVSGFVSGIILGTTQWLALRRYVPDWLWMLATTAGYVILMPILQAWQRVLLEQVLPIVNGFSLIARLPDGVAVAIPGILGILLSTICTIWLGVAQWCVLRQYARSSWLWVYVPSLAVLIAGSIGLLQLWLPAVNAVVIGGLTAGMFGVVPAIVLCTLRQPFKRPEIYRSSPLSVAPEITHRRQIRKLGHQLFGQINHVWATEGISDRPVRYLVGVDETGTIVDYEPETLLAADCVEQTPLPDIADASGYIDSVGNSQALARFQVTFMPSGSLKVRSWCGMPLLWVSLILVGLLLATGAIVGICAEKLPIG